MSRVEFEPTIPVFERARTVHALEHAASVIGTLGYYPSICLEEQKITETSWIASRSQDSNRVPSEHNTEALQL
jgi:hypothetical protein